MPPRVRKDMPSVQLDRTEFIARYRARFHDPAFRNLETEISAIAEVAWEAYSEYRKAPVTRKAGPGYADPDYDLAVEWIEASERIREAEAAQKNPASPSRILLVNGASRSNQTCPGEASKTWRLAQAARDIFARQDGWDIEDLDLSRLSSEYGRHIHPCKTCVSTAMPLCHWPCSCYPNHALGQVQDWMHDIYPMWSAAHGVMILTPVNWYTSSSALKLMIDRLVCADGGNPDPTSTHGKDPAKAKDIELAGWGYPRHLAGRVFSVVVHGDAVGAEGARADLAAWLSDIGLVEAGHLSQLSGYIGYKKPYATSHEDLDRDEATFEEVRNAARALVSAVQQMRAGHGWRPDIALKEPRPK
ncbi:MAG TPA: flavodoxin family protein [Xanthobacteraceae bacterium]|nr:flavodoxin family protein [Xanthobacteraceae bacterium]